MGGRWSGNRGCVIKIRRRKENIERDRFYIIP